MYAILPRAVVAFPPMIVLIVEQPVQVLDEDVMIVNVNHIHVEVFGLLGDVEGVRETSLFIPPENVDGDIILPLKLLHISEGHGERDAVEV